MGKPTTLMDRVLRSTWDKHMRKLDPDAWLRTNLLAARRFVLDEEMSALCADLAYSGYIRVFENHRDELRGTSYKNTPKINSEIQTFLDSIRCSARLPHKATWIELDYTARSLRRDEILGRIGEDTRDAPWLRNSPAQFGWLLTTHPTVETSFMAVSFLWPSVDVEPGTLIRDDAPVVDDPGAMFAGEVWTVEMDGTPAWEPYHPPKISRPAHTWLTGFPSYDKNTCGLVPPPWITNGSRKWETLLDDGIAQECASDLRYLWSLLACINDLPTRASDVVATHGFVARGQYRKFLNHQVVKLTVPMAEARRVAEQIKLARRRAHEVRGHWRKDWRNPGERIWVKEHQRGDASLGFVTHSYELSLEKK